MQLFLYKYCEWKNSKTEKKPVNYIFFCVCKWRLHFTLPKTELVRLVNKLNAHWVTNEQKV